MLQNQSRPHGSGTITISHACQEERCHLRTALPSHMDQLCLRNITYFLINRRGVKKLMPLCEVTWVNSFTCSFSESKFFCCNCMIVHPIQVKNCVHSSKFPITLCGLWGKLVNCFNLDSNICYKLIYVLYWVWRESKTVLTGQLKVPRWKIFR